MSIKIKLTLLFVILSCIPLSFFGLLSLASFESALTENLFTQLTTTTELYKQNVIDYVDNTNDRLREVVTLSELRQVASAGGEISTSLLKIQDSFPDRSRVFMINNRGRIIHAPLNNLIGKQFSHSGKLFAGTEKLAYLSKNEMGDDVLFFYTRLDSSNPDTDQVVLELPVGDFARIFVDRFGLGETGELAVVGGEFNNNQEVIVLNSKQGRTTEVDFYEIVTKFDEGSLIKTSNESGDEVLAVITKIKEVGVNLIILANQNEIFAPVEKLSRSLVSLLAISLIFVGLLAYLSAKNLAAPIQKLVAHTQLVARMKSLSLVEIESNDEFAELGRSFNLMATELTDFHDNLEKKVAERTKELEESRKKTQAVVDDLAIQKEYSQAQAHELLKFKQAVEAASDLIVITDVEGMILYANPVVESLTGYSRREAIGQKAGKLWGGLMSKEFFTKMWHTIKDEKNIFIGEITNRHKSGREYVTLVKVSPVLDKNNNVLFFVGIERDITHEKEIDKAKTEFVSLASHQLRTPLSIIRWYVDTLIQGKGGAVKSEGANLEYLKAIDESNIRMISLVGALLNVSRMELGTFSVSTEPVKIAELIEAVIGEHRPLIDQKQLHVQIDLPADLPVIALDKNLTLIILQNLISNAIKYTPDGGQISISVKTEEKQLVLRVADTGYGIPIEQQANVFTKLFRADNVKKKDVVGTGLGLYLVKSILDEVGGQISFESKVDVGTTFKINLPLSGMRAKAGSKQLEWNELDALKE